ncbi:MAG TPA: POTRA domain-containing protein, partial [Nitrospirota bacterium]
MKSPRIVAGIILAWCLLFPAHAPSSELSGKTVTRIDIRDDQGRPWPRPEQVLSLITLQPGAALSAQAVRESISLLYLKGLFRDIRVDAFPDEGGARLEFVLFPITVVGKIKIHGNSAISTSSISEAIASLEGHELRDEKLSAARTDILALYQAQGFYETSVAFRTEPLKEAHRVLLHIDVRDGAPTKIEEIVFSGNTVFTEKELLGVMKSKKGARLRRDRLLDSDREAILKKYADAGYPAAKAGPVDIRFRDNKAYVRIPEAEGPKVTIRFAGNSVFSDSRLSKALLIWSEHDVSDAVLDSSVDRIETLYREKGYADIAVTVKKTEKPGALDLDFTVVEGKRVTVRAITVSGNTLFTSQAIKDQMALRESGWFFSRPFREDLLDKDIDYLQDRYQSAGHLSAQVHRTVTRTADGKHADVALAIDEGELMRTGDVSFEGNRLFSATELLNIVALKPSAPFNDQTVDEDKYRILTAYANKGYLYARVDVDRDLRDSLVDIRYRITEDLPVLIGRIILRGNETTQDRVIMRELQVKTGDTYDYGAILDSQQRIYRLGYFRVARFEPVRPGEKEYVKDMLLTMEERPAGAVEFGVGYGDLDRLRGFVEVSHRNLWGTARYANLRYEESDILKRAIFNYQEPWFLGRRLDAKFSLVWSDS